MGKTRAECSQNAYTSAFLGHWIQILANSSPKSDISKKKKKKTTLFFRILRSVGRGQHNNFFFGGGGPYERGTELTLRARNRTHIYTSAEPNSHTSAELNSHLLPNSHYERGTELTFIRARNRIHITSAELNSQLLPNSHYERGTELTFIRARNRTHITSAEPNSLSAGVQDPLKGPGSYMVVLMLSRAIWALFLSILMRKKMDKR